MAAPAEPLGEATAGDASPELGLLKKLLFRNEQARLDALQAQSEAFAARIGDAKSFETATAEVLAGALRRAEVANHRELSQAIAPLVLAAIRSEIVNSRDMMVDALYPITGRLVAAAVGAAFRDLVANVNARLDALLSTQLWRMRLRALLTGRPLSEILLEAAQRPQVRLLLALQRDTGQVLASWRKDEQSPETTELVGGMIAAISQFSVEAFASQHGELRTLDMGASRILLRASPRLIVAAEFLGEPHAGDEARMDRALSALIENGPATPDDAALMRVAENFSAPARRPSSGRLKIMLGLAALVLGVWAWLGPIRHRLWEGRLHEAFAQSVAAQPALKGWPLRLTLDRSRHSATIGGLAPPQADVEALSQALARADTPYAVAADVTRVAPLADQQAALVDMAARNKALAAQASALAQWRQGQETQARAPQRRLSELAQRTVIFFGDGVDFKDADAAKAQIAGLAALLKESGLGLRIVGYSDQSGTAAANMKLSQKRAEAVAAEFVAQGVESINLAVVGRGGEGALAAQTGAQRALNRRVTFEMLAPPEPAP